MSVSALMKISDPSYMTQIWEEMYTDITKDNRNRSGIDRVSAEKFNKEKSLRILDVCRSIRSSTYQPSLLEAHFIPKSPSKDRVICVPTILDRLVQRTVLKFLNESGYTLNNSVSFGFIKGKENGVKPSLERAVVFRNSNKWVYKADISSFFDSVDRSLLKKAINNGVRCRSLRPLICLFVDSEVSNESHEAKVKLKKNGILFGKGLRQGMPISPYLANLYLKPFDEVVIKKNLKLIRYADDLIAFSNSNIKCNEIHHFCTELTQKLKLSIHPLSVGNKTSISSPTETVEFLGIGIAPNSRRKYKLIITPARINAIKEGLKEYSNLKYCVKNNINASKLLPLLQSKINGCLEAYNNCDNYQSLADSLMDTKTEVLVQVFSKGLGLDFRTLSKYQKEFLMLNASNSSP